jgi:SAM-dependent methyltransferase
MKPSTFNRLHELRMENDAARFAQEEMRPRFDRITHRHANGTAPRAVSAFQLFQTPAELASRLVAALNLAPGARVLEPSAGLGRILDALKPAAPREVVAVEMAANLCGELFQQDRPGVQILQRDFLGITPERLELFDAVAMNPPFHLRSDVRHILHARQFLKPGGRLAALCLNTHHRATALRPLCDLWEVLPESTFAKEGTRVSCVLLSMKATGGAQ